jgi:hypothetical protein
MGVPVLRAVRLQRGAGEDEFVFGLTGHGAMIPEDDPVDNSQFLPNPSRANAIASRQSRR